MATEKQIWECSVCTFHNSLKRTRCDMCHTPNVQKPVSNFEKWTCLACTFVNESYSQKCSMCHRMKTKQDSQWICKTCHFWNDQINNKCFKCLTNRNNNIPNPVKKPPRLERRQSKDDIDTPGTGSPPKTKNPAFKLLDRIVCKHGKKPEDVQPKPIEQADDLRSSLRAGDLIMYQPNKINSGTGKKSDHKDNQKTNENDQDHAKNKDKNPSIPKSRKAKRDKRISGWIPKFMTKQKDVKKEPERDEDTVDELRKVKRDDLKSSFRAGDLIVGNVIGMFDKDFRNGQEMVNDKTGQNVREKFKSPNDGETNLVKKSKNIWTADIHNQMLDRKFKHQEKVQYPISDRKRKDDLRSSRSAGDLVIWDPVKKSDFERKIGKQHLGNDKNDFQREQAKRGGKPPSPMNDKVEFISPGKETGLSKHQQIRNSIRKFDIKFKDKLKAFEQEEDKEKKPVLKDDLRSSRKAGDLFLWQRDGGIGAKPKIKPAMPDITAIKPHNGGVNKKPVAQPRTSLQRKIDEQREKNEDAKKSVKYHAVDNFVVKIVEDPIPKIKRKDDLRTSRNAGDLIIWQPDKMSHFKHDDIRKSKDIGKVVSKDAPKIQDTPRKKDTPPCINDMSKILDIPGSRDIRKSGDKTSTDNKFKNQDLDKYKNKEITIIPKTRVPQRNVVPSVFRQSSKDDIDQPEPPVSGKAPRPKSKAFQLLDKLLKVQEKDPEPKPKRKDDLRSSIRAGDLFIWDPDKKQDKKEKTKQKSEQGRDIDPKLKRQKVWTCKLCSSKNEPDQEVCRRCLSPKPDLNRQSRRSKILRRRELISRKSTRAVDVRKKEEQEARTKWANIVDSCIKVSNLKYTGHD